MLTMAVMNIWQPQRVEPNVEAITVIHQEEKDDSCKIKKKKKKDLYHHVSFPDALPSRQVFGNKDTDGFYRAEIRDRVGLIPCNMVSEIQTEDDDMMDQLLDQGFLPLNTPVEKLGRTSYSFCCLANCLSSVLY